MLSTCCTLTKTVFVLLFVAATYQLAITAPIVRRQTSHCPTCNPSSAAHLKFGLSATSAILNQYSNVSTVEQNFNTANNNNTVAIERVCDLLAYYYLVRELNENNDLHLLFIILKRTILDACNYWVNFACTLHDLKEFGQRCRNVRLLNVTNDADSKTQIANYNPGNHSNAWVTHLKRSHTLTNDLCKTLSEKIRPLNSSAC